MSIQVLLDVTGDGTLTDITDRIRDTPGVAWSRGNDQLQEYSPTAAGIQGWDADNQDRYFSTENMSSPYYGQVVPGRAMQLKSTGTSGGHLSLNSGGGLLLNASGYLLTTGTPAREINTALSDEISENPAKGQLSVSFGGLGLYSKLRGKKVSTALYQNIRTDEALVVVLDAAGFTDYTLDTGNVTLSWWWWNGDAADAAYQLRLTEGIRAALYEGRDGSIIFKNSTHRLTETKSITSQAIFSDITNIIPGFKYDPNFKNLTPAASVSQEEREAQALQPIWSLPETIVLAANETWTRNVKTTDPFTGAVEPSPAKSSASFLLTASRTLTSGTFKYKFRGEICSTASNWNDSAATHKANLESISTIGSGSVLVSGDLNTGLLVTLTGALGGQEITDQIEIVENALNPVSVHAEMVVSEIQQGNGTLVEVQLIAPSGSLVAGSYTISLDDGTFAGTTGSLSYSANAAAIQAAIRLVAGFGSTSCFGGPFTNGASVQVNFVQTVAMPLMVINPTGLMTTAPGAVITCHQSDVGGVPDYTLTDGELISKSLSQPSGTSTTLTLVAGSSGATLTGLRLRAQPVIQVRSATITYPEGAENPIDFNIWPCVAKTTAETFTQEAVARYSTRRPTCIVPYMPMRMDSTQMDEVLRYDIGWRVTVIDAQTGLATDFFIEREAGQIANSVYSPAFGLEKAD